MSPTYPTLRSDEEIGQLLGRIGELDPSVVFHEPINPRGKNHIMTVAAAEEAGCDGLAEALTDVQGDKAWLRYACHHFDWVQRQAERLDVPVHLWPDKQLPQIAEFPERTWLKRWRERQSPEPFAGRPTPRSPPPEAPPIFSWESQTTLLEGGVE